MYNLLNSDNNLYSLNAKITQTKTHREKELQANLAEWNEKLNKLHEMFCAILATVRDTLESITVHMDS